MDLAHTETFDGSVLTTAVPFTVRVAASQHATMDFTFLGKSYIFRVKTTGGKNTDRFVKSFHSHTPRDAATFGDIGKDAAGVRVVNMSTAQKIAAVVQACKDITVCLDKILCIHQGSVVDYALWYRVQHPEIDDYSSLITLTTCHCIVGADFMSPDIQRRLVKF